MGAVIKLRAAPRLNELPTEIIDRIAERFCHETQDGRNLLLAIRRHDREQLSVMKGRRLKLWGKAVAHVRGLESRPTPEQCATARQAIETACLRPGQLSLTWPFRSYTSSSCYYRSGNNESFYRYYSIDYVPGWTSFHWDYSTNYVSDWTSSASTTSSSECDSTLPMVLGLLVFGVLCIGAAYVMAHNAYDWHYAGKKHALLAGNVAKGRLAALNALQEHAPHVGLSRAQLAEIVNNRRKHLWATRRDVALTAGLVAVAVGFAAAAITAAGVALGPWGACVASAMVVGIWYVYLRPNVRQMAMPLPEAREIIFRDAWCQEIYAIDQKVRNA